MKIQKPLLLFAAIALVAQAHALALELAWSRTLGGDLNAADIGVDIAVDGANNVAILGVITDTQTLGRQVLVRKYDKDGNVLFTQKYGFEDQSIVSLEDRPGAIASDAPGNTYVAADVIDGSFAGIEVRKFDAAGNQVFKTGFGKRSRANDIVVDAAGNSYVCGSLIEGQDAGAVVMKLSPSGAVLWKKEDFSNGPAGVRLVLDSTGQLYVAGDVRVGDSDIFVQKHNPETGDVLWTQRFEQDFPDDAETSDIAIDQSGRLVVGGTWRRTDGNISPIVFRINRSNGTVVFPDLTVPDAGTFTIVAGINNLFSRGIAAGPLNEIIVAGTGQISGGNNVFLAAYYASNGTVTFGNLQGPGIEANDVVSDGLNSRVFGGSLGGAGGTTKFTVMRNPGKPNSASLSLAGAGNVPQDSVHAVAMDGNGDILAVGFRRNASNNDDIAVMKVTQAPIAAPEEFHILKGGALHTGTPGVKANDSVSAVSNAIGTVAAPGTFSRGVGGNVDYAPVATFVGAQTFSYKLVRGSQESNVAQDTIFVHPPINGLILASTLPGGEFASCTINFNGNEPSSPMPGTITSSGGLITSLADWKPAVGANSASITLLVSGVAANTTQTVTVSRFGQSFSKTVTIQQGGLASFTINPLAQKGGQTFVASAAFGAPAPPGKTLTVNDNSPNTSFPGSINIVGGASSVSFNITTTAVTAPTNVDVTAVLGSSIKKQTITLLPQVELSLLSLNASTLHGGQSGVLTMSLTGTAQADLTIALSDNSSAIDLPATGVVHNGFNLGNVDFKTTQVSQAATRTITASFAGVTKTINLTILPSPTLTAFTISPTSAVGGQSVNGTITLSAAISNQPFSVAGSDTSNFIDMPTSIGFTAGQSSKTFSIGTQPVTATATRQVSASLLGVTKTANLTLNPAGELSTLAINPASVKGGNPSTGTVTLTAPGQALVVCNLTDNSGSVSTPGSVTVPIGSFTASFTVTTLAVSATATRVVTATHGAVSKTANITLTP